MLSAFTMVTPKLVQGLQQEEIPVAERIYVNLEMFDVDKKEWVTVGWTNYKASEIATPIDIPAGAGVYRIETFPRTSDGHKGKSTLSAPFKIK
jgi:hypothetical protein